MVSFEEQVQSWVNQLCDLDHWQPGCIVVDQQDRTWTAIAGSERDDALMWLARITSYGEISGDRHAGIGFLEKEGR